MPAQQNVLGLVHARREIGRTALIRVELLHQSPVCLSDLIGGGPRSEDPGPGRLPPASWHPMRTEYPPVALLIPSVFTPMRKPTVEIGLEKANAVRIAGMALRQQIQ